MGAGYKCLKVTFIVFNAIFWLLGCGVLGVGVWLQIDKGGYAQLLQDYSAFTAAVLCIVAGSVMVIFGVVGCCGAFLESRCMLIVYFFALVIVFLLEIVAGIIGFIRRKEISGAVRTRLLKNIHSEYDGNGSDDEGKYGRVWDLFQQEVRYYIIVAIFLFTNKIV